MGPAAEKCFRDGALYGASVTAITTGLFFSAKRNWALVALGGLGLYLAKGGTVTAETLQAPELPDVPSLPTMDKLRSLFPGATASVDLGRMGPRPSYRRF
jgi:hypothetical protein